MPPPPPGRPPVAQALPVPSAGNVPMAIPLTGAITGHVPIAHPVSDNSSWRSWFNATPVSKNVPLLVGGVIVILLGMTFMLVALLSLAR